MVRIEDSLHELFLEIINTVPIQPIGAYIEFVADGILPLSNDSSEAQQISYINDCEQSQLLPFSGLELSYHRDGSQDLFLSPNDRPLFNTSSVRQYDQMAKSYVQGGRFHRIGVKIGGEHDDEFGQFITRKDGLDYLTDEQYKIHRSVLTLSIEERAGGYAPGIYPNTTLTCSCVRSLPEVRLDVGKRLQAPNLAQLGEWYCDLVKEAAEPRPKELVVAWNGASYGGASLG